MRNYLLLAVAAASLAFALGRPVSADVGLTRSTIDKRLEELGLLSGGGLSAGGTVATGNGIAFGTGTTPAANGITFNTASSTITTPDVGAGLTAKGYTIKSGSADGGNQLGGFITFYGGQPGWGGDMEITGPAEVGYYGAGVYLNSSGAGSSGSVDILGGAPTTPAADIGAFDNTYRGGVTTGSGRGGGHRFLSSIIGTAGATSQNQRNDRFFVVNKHVVLPNDTATDFLYVLFSPSTSAGGFAGSVHYTVVAKAGTEIQSAGGSFNFAGSGQAGGSGMALDVGAVTETQSRTTGTMTNTTSSAPGGGQAQLKFKSTSSLTTPTITFSYTVMCGGNVILAPQ